MKFCKLSSAALAAAMFGALATVPALAQDSDERTATGSDSGAEPNPFYNAFKIQQLKADFDDLDEAFNFGSVVAGFRLPGELKWLGVEIELSQTVIPGENNAQGGLFGGGGGSGGEDCSDPGEIAGVNCTVTQGSANNSGDTDDFGVLSGGIYAVARSTGQYYVGARAGYSSIFNSSIEVIDGESDFSYGVLAGLRFGNNVDSSSVELEFGEMAADIEVLSLNFITRFGN